MPRQVITKSTYQQLPFRPRARILQLLGDQLIGSSRLAVFELVKNAYDADARNVFVTLNDIESDEPSIVIEDDGIGMSPYEIENIWLVPAHSHKEKQREGRHRTIKGRLPLGEKGLGRFAVHKLGDQIELITRAKNGKECLVQIDWSQLIEKEFLSEANVTLQIREPEFFCGDATGTRIVISKLREKKWKKRDVRQIYRQLTSIISPYSERSDSFTVTMSVPEHPEWLKDILDVDGLLELAPWHFKFTFENGKISWDYRFSGLAGIKLEPRTTHRSGDTLLVPHIVENYIDAEAIAAEIRAIRAESVVADKSWTAGIGPVEGEFFAFDRDQEVLNRLGSKSLLTDYLDLHGGVRVYRDGIRVYNYGERGDDWLGLDLRRVNIPAKRISRNIIVGAIFLSLEHSLDLKEKTNREGFVENDAYNCLREIVIGALSLLEIERKKDKDRIRHLTGKEKNIETSKIIKPLESLRAIGKKHNISQELDPLIDKAQSNYNEMREIMLTAGFAGVGLATVFHEIEHGVRLLSNAMDAGTPIEQVKEQARELARILDGFSELIRKKERKLNSFKKLIRRARDLNQVRFRKHGVRLVCPYLEDEFSDIEGVFSFGMALGSLNNLLDNAFYWLKVRWPDKQLSRRMIYLNIDTALTEGPAIIVSDNGPGLEDEPEMLIRPYFTRRPNGMGLGLFYTNMAMELNGGFLFFPEDGDINLPDECDGATFALVFGKKREAI